MAKTGLKLWIDHSSFKETYTSGDTINAVVELRAYKSVDIKEIMVSFVGRVTTNYKADLIKKNGPETREFLNISHQVLPMGVPRTFMANSNNVYDMPFQVPMSCNGKYQNEVLPPSMSFISSSTGSIEVMYSIEVRVTKASFFKSVDQESVTIDFRPTFLEDLLGIKQQKTILSSIHNYENKSRKTFEFNELESVSSDRRLGIAISFLNKLFRKKPQVSKNVLLITEVSVSSVLEPGCAIEELQLKFSTPIDSLRPDFSLKNYESTGLGEFRINCAKVDLVQEIIIKTSSKESVISNRFSLYNQESTNTCFDIAFFDPCEDGYCQSFNLTEYGNIFVPMGLTRGFACCNDLIRISYTIEVEIQVQGDEDLHQFAMKKDIRIVDPRPQPRFLLPEKTQFLV